MKRKYYIAALILATVVGVWYGCGSTGSSPVNLRFGILDDELTVNSKGSMTFESGSSADFESGSELKIAGTALTPTAAELNYNAGVTPGTVLASKTIMAGVGRSINYLAVRDTLAFFPSPYSDVVDSGLVVYRLSGQPVLSFRGADDDEWSITINTSDQAVFQSAGGGYVFDDDINVRMSPYSDNTDSTMFFTITSGEPVINFRASDDDAMEITVNTSDQMVFQNAGGGYSFDGDLVLENGETISNGTDGVVTISAILQLPLNATLPDTTGFTGGEIFTFTGDSLYVYKADHTIASIP